MSKNGQTVAYSNWKCDKLLISTGTCLESSMKGMFDFVQLS